MPKERLTDIILGIDTTWTQPLAVAAKYAQLTTPKRKAAFIGQIYYESAELTDFEENMNYTAERLMVVWPSRFPTLQVAQQYARQPQKLANYVYANRLGNGPASTNDGWLYRGRTPIHLTGKDNYRRVAKNLNIDIVNHPDTANDPENMMLIAADYWTTNKLNTYADDWRITELSKRIVGDTRTAAARLAWCDLALKTYEGLEKLAK